MAAFRVFLIVLALTAPVWALHATSVSACSCAGDSFALDERLRAAEVAVVGEVIDVRVAEELPIRTPQLLPDGSFEQEWFGHILVEAEFAVTSVLRGSAPEQLVVQSNTAVGVGAGDEVYVQPGGGADCGYGFELGARYLLYFAEADSESLRTSSCASNKVFIQSDQHLEELKEILQEPTPQPTVADLPDTGTGGPDPSGSFAWQVTAAAAGVLLAVSASAALVVHRRRLR